MNTTGFAKEAHIGLQMCVWVGVFFFGGGGEGGR